MSLSNPIFNLFGRSPISPMKAHMKQVSACAQTLEAFFEAVYIGDWEMAAKVQQQVTELEHSADELKKELRSHLPKGLFLPVSRSDLLQLLSVQDKIANKAKDISGLVLGRRLTIPKAIADDFQQLLQRSIAAVEVAHKAIRELDQLLEAGFRGYEVKRVEKIIQEISNIEYETDEIQVRVRYSLYKIEQEISPIDAMFLYKIIEWCADLADHAENVGHRLELLLAK